MSDALRVEVPRLSPSQQEALRKRVKSAIRDGMTGPLDGVPAPEHFRFDPDTGRCGLIDWGAASAKPRLYDVATVVMDAGGPEGARPLLRDYLDERALMPLLDFRYAINALYYAERVLRGDVTGVDDISGNEDCLEEAYRWLIRPPAHHPLSQRSMSAGSFSSGNVVSRLDG